MAGRTLGFLGGVLLATSAAYYTSEEFKKSSQFVSRTLQQTQDYLDYNPLKKKQIEQQEQNKPIPRSLEFEYRPSIKQTIADLWDEQVLNLAKSIYSIDIEKSTNNAVESIQSFVNNISK
ncbi:hypothetical protein WICMUC_005447 [Wickerhamomyces mucosus]|uniref:MICOS complex subunit MIC12 n=1 Tax=Wickerhamomyces mucosus TaxID=1378264 RepID=A0A9P8T6H6_9ASCO|nr:hypothetical protein WICMUC_005447 [Wickerhamomyces mucosus]